MAAQLPERHLILAREITKVFKTFPSGMVTEIQTALKNDSDQARGEMVLVLHPAVREKYNDLPKAAQNTMKVPVAELPTKQVAELAARATGGSKRILYDLALERKRISDDIQGFVGLFSSARGVNNATTSYRQKAGYRSLSVCQFYRLHINKILSVALLPPPS